MMYFLVYFSIMFYRFFSIFYIWGTDIGGRHYNSLINTFILLPSFNVILGILMLKVIIETLSKDEIVSLIKLSCLVTFIASLHMIGQRFEIIQVFGHEKFSEASGTGWRGGNHVVGFIGNPMVMGNFIAIASQFNLFFRDRLHYVFYIVGFIATVFTFTAGGTVSYIICAIVFFLVYNRKVAYGLIGVSVLSFGSVLLLDQWGILTERFYSFSDRLGAWKASIDMWWKMPYTGTGLGTYRAANTLVNTTNWWQVHCEPLQIMQELGLIGLGLVSMIFIRFFRGIKTREIFVCGLVVLSGILNSIPSFPLHIAPCVFILILAFAFTEILKDKGKYVWSETN
jgi:O-antigen ligase